MRARSLAIVSLLFVLLLAGLPAGAAEPLGAPESLSGSFVSFDPAAGGDACYVPGATKTFCFDAETYTDDWEWATDLWMRFPADWSVTDVYVQGTPTCELGSFGDDFEWAFVTSPYEVQITHTRDMETNDHCAAVYCFDVTSGSGEPYAQESWYWNGDGWGDPPYNPCSSDGYTPSGQFACDESVHAPAAIPPCNWPAGIYVDPGQVLLQGCNGVPQPASFSVTNRTGSAGTFDVAYSIPTGNGSLTGPATLTIGDGQTISLDVEITPALCAEAGQVVDGLAEITGNGFSAQGALQETVVLGNWELMAPHPVPTSSWVVLSSVDPANGLEYLYVFGSVRLKIYRYDPRANVWATLATLPDKLYDAGDGAAYNGHLYARTDGQGSITHSLFDYNIAANTWSATPVPGAYADRGLYEAVELNGWLYFIGGGWWEDLDLVATSEVDRYNPATGAWEAVAPLTEKRAYAAAWSWNGRIYVAGGYNEDDYLLTTEVYDPATNSWTEDEDLFASLPVSWDSAADAVLHGDQLWVMGGNYSYIESNRTAYWTASDNEWHMGPRLAEVVIETEGDVLDGHLQVVGGLFGGVKDFNQRLVECPSCLAWAKQVNGTPWQAGVPVVVQTHDTLTVTETVQGSNFALDQGWDPAKLALLEYEASDGTVVAGQDSLEWQVPYGGGGSHTLTQTFRVLPCTWTEATLEETLWSEGRQVDAKPVQIEKTPSALWLEADYSADVLPGEPAAFTLTYGNTGGLENDAMVRAEFPAEAPFESAVPAPDRVDPAGLWAEWDLGDLAQDAQGSIDVTELVADDAPSGPLAAAAMLYDHTGAVGPSVTIQWLVAGPESHFLYLPLIIRNQ